MVDKGWRKRLHDKRPKTPAPGKAATEDTVQNEHVVEKSERIRSHPTEKLGWRRIYHGSRPETPVASPTIAVGFDDTEDNYSEISSEAASTWGKSTPKAPKLTHYLSTYRALTAPETQEFSFSEPWCLFAPPREPLIDPLEVMQKIRSHIGHQSWVSLPAEYNNGILRIFEEFRKVSEEKERTLMKMKETLDAWESDQEKWDKAEDLYKKEIRRLELLIAQGKSGMSGLITARQGSILRRKQTHRQTLSFDRSETAYKDMGQGQLDEQIKVLSQRVTLQRPTSPSGMMAALSRRLTNQGPAVELSVGTPPRGDPKGGLSREVKSELDLMKMGTITEPTTDPLADSIPTSNNCSPNEPSPLMASGMDIAVECEAFVALRDLATLVARRRGMDVESFVRQLMKLYSTPEETGCDISTTAESNVRDRGADPQTPGGSHLGTSPPFSRPLLRRFRSEPHLAAGKDRHRHFSFEPGDDHLGKLNDQLLEFERNRPKSPAGSQSTKSSETQNDLDIQEQLSSHSQGLSADAPRPSKIPSPMHHPALVRPRREGSSSSVKTVSGRDRHRLDDRRDSRSSVVTAFRQNSDGSLRRPETASRSSSTTSFRHTEADTRDLNGGNRLRNSAAALAAARVANNNSVQNQQASETRKEDVSSTATYSRTQKHFPSSKSTLSRYSENDHPSNYRQLS